MPENELMVTIPYSRLEQLLDMETRAEVLKVRVTKNSFIGQEEAADILGFVLSIKKNEGDDIFK
jgi:hypothetical protein